MTASTGPSGTRPTSSCSSWTARGSAAPTGARYTPAATVGWGWNDGGIEGASWASWGPRGLSCGHLTREAAEVAQVREYVTDPDRYDRVLAAERAKREDEAERPRRRRDLQQEGG